MHKFLNISVAVAISSFIAVNLYLLFGEKSIIPKSLHVSNYERTIKEDFSVKLAKEALIAPVETVTIYIGNEEEVESWLVTEGDVVQVGQELAALNTKQSESQRNVWESERDVLKRQAKNMEGLISTLKSDRADAKKNNSSKTNNKDNVKEGTGDTGVEIGLNVDVEVQVALDGSFAQAIATAEQELADLDRQLTVVEAQLSQNPARPAIISPMDGVVTKVERSGPRLAIELFSQEKIITTYAKGNEWEDIREGLRVLIQGHGTKGVIEGTIESVSSIPAVDNDWFKSYKILDPVEEKNPLAYYEVRIEVEPDLETIPFGNNLNAIVIVDEAKDAASVNEKWIIKNNAGSATGTIINGFGRAANVGIETPFEWKTRAVVTEGLELGNVVINGQDLHGYDYAPKVILAMPSYMPGKSEWKSFGWKRYLEYMIVK
ncbi:efflux RND transporter periplasmic adaptor subunit [Sporosarcina sp. G11-34]|uniref:efflux RND transporter periplasmic adaptor subunit n=1 Tax=Sporosarcina sp. G11-34 TaxID=2849605 RepID=UPI0022A963B1|nr:efflux RND transporter periplasmic adaptor subunit [Sporosarcina sp. G11-34]MCZ2257561.1 efflux RND transporter periplasmic adaptor subunit [Sporosarcina sp. G11-34]